MIPFVTRFNDAGSSILISKPIERDLNVAVNKLLERAAKKHSGYIAVELDTPFRPRTTGEKSQNHRINGFVQQMARSTGNDFDTVKMYCKREALSEGYPFQTLPNGETWPVSEAKLSVEQASILIGTIQRIAAEWGIKLREQS